MLLSALLEERYMYSPNQVKSQVTKLLRILLFLKGGRLKNLLYQA